MEAITTKSPKESWLVRLAFTLLLSFVPAVGQGIKLLRQKGKGIHDRHKLVDLFSVVRAMGFFLVLELIAILVFLSLPQGRDTLLLVSENLVGHQYGSLLFLLTGVFLWSITAEFGARYAIYVTDNSGKSLSADRVEWRKSLQKTMAAVFLLLPPVIIITGILINWIAQGKDGDQVSFLYFLVPILLFYWLFCILTRLYFPHKRKFYWPLSSAALDADERSWAGKLYGIYNEFVYSFPKPGNFKEGYADKLTPFTNSFTSVPQTERHNFPQDHTALIDALHIPDGFNLAVWKDEKNQNDEPYRWIFSIPFGFYKNLHKQLWIVALVSLLVFLIIASLPVPVYTIIGAPGLLGIAFACWSGIYVGLLYTDFALLRGKKFSVRIALIVLLLLCSYFNHDHPIRLLPQRSTVTREALVPHFRSWLGDYKKRFPANFKGPYPVVFICAEGGALRTGAYTALFLTQLQETLAKNNKLDFKHAVFAMSGVSGGSVGLSCFNAINYLAKPGDLLAKDLSGSAQNFFEYDDLSPVIGKMFYGDILNLFSPRMIANFDRAGALETAWEYAYANVVKPGAANIYNQGFLKQYQPANKLPALLINTTEVETGTQCWMSTIKPGTLIGAADRDLLNKKICNDIRYSTAVNFSSRFPLFSPAGMLVYEQKKSHKLHYLDGGYFENTGSGTMYELLTALRREKDIRQAIRPVVILLRFSNDTTTVGDINFGNEMTEIVAGLYNTRGGHSHMATQMIDTLAKYFRADTVNKKNYDGGFVIDEPLSADQRQVPMNWVLSSVSMQYIKQDVNQKLTSRKSDAAIPVLTNCGLHLPFISNK